MTPDQEREFEALKNSQKKMGETLEKMMASMEKSNSKLDSVYYALVGNEIGKDGGMVERMIHMNKRMDDLEDKIDKMKDEYDKIVAKGRGMIIASVCSAGIIGYLIQYIINHF